jgi:endonuclease/exonuclease/phosphatase family metal-dependent hydrolase
VTYLCRVGRRVALLVAVAVLAVCGLVGCSDGSDPSDAETSPAVLPRPAPADRLPGRLVDTIGVASFNVYRHLPRREALADALRITGEEQVDVIGWQETRADYFPDVKRRLTRRGWDTWQLWESDGPFWLAVSWRRDAYSLVDGAWTEVHGGAGKSRTDLPYPPRGYVVVRLRHRASGRLLTVVDTHLNQGIETGSEFTDRVNADDAKVHLRALADVWDEVPGDLVVGTGDFNFNYADDAEAHPEGGIGDTQHGHASSSYDVLGLDGVVPTREDRWIDYVWIADRTLRVRAKDSGAGQFVAHRSLRGFHSDHRPLVARIRWYDR